MVDKYIPNLAACLRDQSELVRRQTLILLTRLLQEDFVKWKGTLFYRFVVSLADPSNEIRLFGKWYIHFWSHEFPLLLSLQIYLTCCFFFLLYSSANLCLTTLLRNKNPLMFFNHFIETIFHLNDYKQHPSYNQFPQSDKEREIFSLHGRQQRRYSKIAIPRKRKNNNTDPF